MQYELPLAGKKSVNLNRNTNILLKMQLKSRVQNRPIGSLVQWVNSPLCGWSWRQRQCSLSVRSSGQPVRRAPSALSESLAGVPGSQGSPNPSWLQIRPSHPQHVSNGVEPSRCYCPILDTPWVWEIYGGSPISATSMAGVSRRHL